MAIVQNETLKGSIAQSDSLAGNINGRQSMSGNVVPRGVDGVSPEIEVSEIEGGNRLTIKDIGGTKTVDIMDGEKGDKGDTGSPGSKGDTGSPGKDGYTPVKGVDYFDGEDGAPGKNGVSPSVSVTTISGGHRVTIVDANGTKTFDVLDGEDGTMSFEDLTPAQKESLKGDDGYTPVKGKDYFDGSDGSDGSDGVSATHSWNGTTLTITSASGTSSANLKGAKGDKGDSGDPGVSPSVSVDAIDGGHRVTVTDATGTQSFDVMDGVDTVEPLIVTADQHFFTSHTAQEIVDAKNEGKMVILNAGIIFVDLNATNADDGTVESCEFSKLMYYSGRPAIMKVTITGNVGVPALSQIDAAAVGAAKSSHSHAWSTITGKPEEFTPAEHSHAWDAITGKPSAFTPATHGHAWGDITGKPSEFAPAAHSHANLSINGTTYNGGSDVDFTSVIESMISSAASGGVNMKYGSYTGANAYGESNPTVIPCTARPKLAIVSGPSNTNNKTLIMIDGQTTAYLLGSTSNKVVPSFGSTELSFYSTTNAATQMNASGKYNYVLFW